ncbi:MAG: aspartate carbamoyltransferase [Patescibacteria group bacterium]|nr:aspartate carbamoyltransferase [Patescibacteria group bacterium]
MKNPFFHRDIVSADQYSKRDIQYILDLTEKMKQCRETRGGMSMLSHRILAALFFEPSSRTFSSFIAAMQRLGGGFIPMHGMDHTSMQKGESFEDTIRTFSSYADVIVLRHPDIGAAAKAAEAADCPVINAGDGIGEHPTQCLQDLFTIRQHIGRIDGIRIAMIGDLFHYRPVNSLAKSLVHFQNVQIHFVSPPQIRIQDSLRIYLRDHGVYFSEHERIDDILPDIDVLYVTRVKKEYMPEDLYTRVHGAYVIDMSVVQRMKQSSIILHPLPRLAELPTNVDRDPRAVYIRDQMKNGMYTRMALLASVLLEEVSV